MTPTDLGIPRDPLTYSVGVQIVSAAVMFGGMISGAADALIVISFGVSYIAAITSACIYISQRFGPS